MTDDYIPGEFPLDESSPEETLLENSPSEEPPEEKTLFTDLSLREQVAYTTMFHEDAGAFYASMFPQMGIPSTGEPIPEEDQDEFYDQLDTEALFEEYFLALVECYGGEEELQDVIISLDKFFNYCADSFEGVPRAMDKWINSKYAMEEVVH